MTEFLKRVGLVLLWGLGFLVWGFIVSVAIGVLNETGQLPYFSTLIGVLMYLAVTTPLLVRYVYRESDRTDSKT